MKKFQNKVVAFSATVLTLGGCAGLGASRNALPPQATVAAAAPVTSTAVPLPPPTSSVAPTTTTTTVVAQAPQAGGVTPPAPTHAPVAVANLTNRVSALPVVVAQTVTGNTNVHASSVLTRALGLMNNPDPAAQRLFTQLGVEYIWVRPGEGVQLPDESVLTLTANSDESRVAVDDRASIILVVLWRQNNPLNAQLNGTTIESVRSIVTRLSSTPEAGLDNVDVQRSGYFTYNWANAVQVGAYFTFTNRQIANMVLGNYGSMNMLTSTNATPQADEECTNWWTRVYPTDFTGTRLTTEGPDQTASAPEFRSVSTRSRSLAKFLPRIRVEVYHNSACRRDNCHPESGQPQVPNGAGVRGCYCVCGVTIRFTGTPEERQQFFPRDFQLSD